jgi:N-acetylmuramoyl-L-alanine amidase
MKHGWKRTVAAIGTVLVAGAVIAATPGEAQAASKPESLSVYIDGSKSQLQAQHYNGKAYITSDGAFALGVKLTAGENDSYTLTTSSKQVNVDKKDIVKINNQLHVNMASVAETLGAKWVEDRLTGSLFVFQRSSTLSSGSDILPAWTGSASGGSEPARPAAGSSVTLSDAVPTLSGILVDNNAVYINATGSVQPKIFQLRNPDRIVIDLPATTLEGADQGMKEGTVAVNADHPYISGIRYALFAVEPATVRIVLDMKQLPSYRMETSSEGTSAAVRFGERTELQYRVMIDAGHGGTDPGAISKTGKQEKDLTLSVARKTAALLTKEPFLVPVPIRLDDVYSSPADRAQLANMSGIDLYVSIHANTAPSSSAKGTETYYWRDDSKQLADIVHSYVQQAVGSVDRKVKQNNYLVVRETTMPAVLLELGFLSNLEDEAKMFDDAVQDKIAAAIVTSIKQYYHIP